MLGDLKLPVGDHVYKLLIKLGFSVQKPGKKPVERDKPAIHTWSRTKGVEISKKVEAGLTLVCLGESGFSASRWR